MKLPDGSIRQSSFAHGDVKKQPESNFPYLILGSVVAVHFKDDVSNLSKKVVEYDVVSWDPEFLFRRVPMVTPKQGVSNGDYFTLEAEAVDPAKNPMDNVIGDIVVLGFIGGELGQPMILGCYPNTKNGVPVGLNTDGDTRTIVHKGTTLQFKDDGELEIISVGESTVTVKADGEILITPATGKKVKVGIPSTAFEEAVKNGLLVGALNTRVGVFNTHTHPDPVSGVTGVPSTSQTSFGATEVAAEDVEVG